MLVRKCSFVGGRCFLVRECLMREVNSLFQNLKGSTTLLSILERDTSSDTLTYDLHLLMNSALSLCFRPCFSPSAAALGGGCMSAYQLFGLVAVTQRTRFESCRSGLGEGVVSIGQLSLFLHYCIKLIHALKLFDPQSPAKTHQPIGTPNEMSKQKSPRRIHFHRNLALDSQSKARNVTCTHDNLTHPPPCLPDSPRPASSAYIPAHSPPSCAQPPIPRTL